MKDPLIIPNYLSNDICDELIGYLLDNKIPFNEVESFATYWKDRVKYPLYPWYMARDLGLRRIETAEAHFGIKLAPVVQSLCLNIWPEGFEMPLHSDLSNGLYPKRNYASMIYLNDNYEGGEIYIPDLNFELKPQKGMLLTFDGANYLHGVKKITKGIRYTNSCWIEVLQ